MAGLAALTPMWSACNLGAGADYEHGQVLETAFTNCSAAA
jgi:hypothetical protein